MIQINGEFQAWLQQQQLDVQGLTPLAGGSINFVARILLSNGGQFVLKQNSNAGQDFFLAEKSGLTELQNALSENNLLRTPSVAAFGETFLVLEDLGAAPLSKEYWTNLASGLARLHEVSKPTFGFHSDNYCGLTPQSNPKISNGYDFFAEHRLLNLTALCRDKLLLSPRHSKRIERIASSLTDWIPQQAPVVLHGDLWAGNIHCDSNGLPALIDPASYWGWAEADIAMTQLFGKLPEEFYRCYAAHGQLLQGWQERIPLYNLYHLLNHLLLFGEAYLPEIEATLKRYLGAK